LLWSNETRQRKANLLSVKIPNVATIEEVRLDDIDRVFLLEKRVGWRGEVR
jgi:hypothetical protein